MNDEKSKAIYELMDRIAENLNGISDSNSQLEGHIRKIGEPESRDKAGLDKAEGKGKEPASIIDRLKMLNEYSYSIHLRYQNANADLRSLV